MNIKGFFLGALKNAVAMILAAAETTKQRAEDDSETSVIAREVARCRKDNDKLRVELAELRREIGVLKAGPALPVSLSPRLQLRSPRLRRGQSRIWRGRSLKR